MTDTEKKSPKPQDHHPDVAIASIWLLVLALIVVMKVGSLLVSPSTLTASSDSKSHLISSAVRH